MNDELVIANHLIQIINNSKQKAMKKVNEELIHMYWEIGEYLYNESQDFSYGDAGRNTAS